MSRTAMAKTLHYAAIVTTLRQVPASAELASMFRVNLKLPTTVHSEHTASVGPSLTPPFMAGLWEDSEGVVTLCVLRMGPPLLLLKVEQDSDSPLRLALAARHFQFFIDLTIDRDRLLA
jgi:hypothetical protein